MVDIKKVKPNGEYRSGKYEPRNPEKYIGDIHNIIYRCTCSCTPTITYSDYNTKSR